jgi:hypothetical protein
MMEGSPMSERTTIGKVTYIHGARPLSGPIYCGDAGLDDPALQAAPPPIPVREFVEPKPDAPSVQAYYGLATPDSEPVEPDEYVVWSPDQTGADDMRTPINWPRVLLWWLILVACIVIWYAAMVFILNGHLIAFIRAIASTLTSTLK